ncbi:MAG: hypothetical protein ACRD07_08525 [Acidimicrobiales bacterium]
MREIGISSVAPHTSVEATTYGHRVSVDQFVFLRKADMPSTSRWQAALDQLGIDLQLNPTLDPSVHSGYWPALLGDHDSGFEYLCGSIPDAFGAPPPDGLNGRDYVINLVTHSDLRELRCAMYAASALAVACDGLCFDEETGGLTSASAVLQEAHSIAEDV